MTTIHRIVYAGVCEVWVEVEGQTITRIIEATAGNLIGKKLIDLPNATHIESKLFVSAPP